jgi:hypothetical protein
MAMLQSMTTEEQILCWLSLDLQVRAPGSKAARPVLPLQFRAIRAGAAQFPKDFFSGIGFSVFLIYMRGVFS